MDVENDGEQMLAKNNTPYVKKGRREDMFCKDTMKLIMFGEEYKL
jgi:hypothetical protein